MKRKPKYFNLALMFVVLISALGFIPKPVSAATSDLFFSEYIEGSSNNKALEIYNGTGAPVDLADYKVILYSNGSVSPGNTQTWSAGTMLADGGVYVIANSSAVSDITDIADITSSVTYFNGNDAVALQKASDDSYVDVLGDIGDASYWGSEVTLVRNASICSGDTVHDDVFDPTAEWDDYAQNTFTYLGSHTANCGEPVIPDLKINEFVADHDGTDVQEFVEVFGQPEADYSDYTILQVEGEGSSAGTIDSVLPVGTTDVLGFWWTGYLNSELENGTITLLLVKDFTGSDGDDLDTDNDGVIDITPWSEITDSVAKNDNPTEFTYGAPDLAPGFDGNSYETGGASRIPDGYDTEATTDWVRNGYFPSVEPSGGDAYNTPGAPNAVQGCGGLYTPIYVIQGNGSSTTIPPFTEVVTEGIVVGDFQEGGKDGFYIQDASGDFDTSTSDGVFVYYPGGPDVAVGDHVRLQGEPEEFYDATQIGWIDWLEVCAVGEPLPAPTVITLPVASVNDFEAYEGMLVTFPQNLVIAEYYDFDRFGTIVLTSQRYLQFTALFEPDEAGYAASMDAYALNSITLDDGRTSQNSDPARHPNGLPFDLYNMFRGGELLTNVIGIMDYGRSISYYDDVYRIQPTEGADYTPTNPRTPAPDIIEGDIKVASLNVYNYFTTIDDGSDICGPVDFFDVIGKLGEDPGSKWGTEPYTTQEHTLVRQSTVCSGDTNSGDPFDPAAEWDAYGQNEFGYLGSHNSSCAFNDLIISEYIEGSSNNKALEIYNGTGAPVDLQDYEVVLYFNGSEEVGKTLSWGSETLIPDGDVYVIANDAADPIIKAVADTFSQVTWFNGDDVVALKKADTGGMECRGADSEEELERQQMKIITALLDIDADVVGLMEIENDRPGPAPDYAVANLVEGLNANAGSGTYDYIATGAIGTDAIKVALIYKPGNVTPVGSYAILDSTVDPSFNDQKNRPALAQTFMDNIVGDAVTVAVNHLKSKGSSCDDLGDPDMDDGQGNCNLTRMAAAQAEVDWLASDPTGTGVENLLIIGDLNAYDKEDPINAIKAGSDDLPGTDDDYFDMIHEILGEAAYSYLYDGKIGYLDYAMANRTLAEYVADVTVWHINADEADLINYDTSYKKDAQDAIFAPDAYRASDHDPVIITLTFNKPPLAEDDYYQMMQDDTLEVEALHGVLENDYDLNEHDVITLDVVVEPLHGTVELNHDGSFTYIPDALYFGEDSFEYLLMANPPERGEFSDTATVYITIDSKYKYYFPIGYGD